MSISLDYSTGIIFVPLSSMTLVQSTPTIIYELDINSFRIALKDIEDDVTGICYTKTHNNNPPVSVGGVDLARVLEILSPYTVTFFNGAYAVNLKGANSNIGDRVNVNNVSVRSANSAGLVNSAAIEYGEYNGHVTVDIIDGTSGTLYPVGTQRSPVNNMSDAVFIAHTKGFVEIYVIGDITLDTGDIVEDLKLVGVSHVNSSLIVNPGAQCLRTSFESFDMTGTLDGDSEIVNCTVRGLTYFDGHIHDSRLIGDIILSGTNEANIENCKILKVTQPPRIIANASGQNLMMPNWSGNLIVEDLTGNSEMAIGMDAGEITISSSCISGIIGIAGSGEVIDNSGDGCYVVDTAVDGTDMNNIQRLLELLRPHHTGTGNVWYWDPYGGNDGFDGRHPDRACKTFACVHDNHVIDFNHDIVICVSGNPAGLTISTETINITKSYMFLRGPGRDFVIRAASDTTNTINIVGDGVEVSGMVVETSATSNEHAIDSTGSFPYIHNLYVENSVNCIHVNAGSKGIIRNVRIGHNLGHALLVDGDSDHFSVYDSHFGSNGGGGVIVATTTGHEVTIQGTTIHGNTGYGVDIQSASNGVHILSSCSIYGNTLGSVNDNGINTFIENAALAVEQADAVWAKTSNTAGSESYGELLEHAQLLEMTVVIDTEALTNGDGSQHAPYNNLTDAIDYAEVHGIKKLTVYADISIDRNLKNFIVEGVGTPKVETGGFDLKNTQFNHCEINGAYIDRITAQDCLLTGTTTLNGFFENCALSSTFTIPDGATTLIKDCSTLVIDQTPPTINIGGASGTANLIVTGHNGGLEILNCNQVTDTVKLIMSVGKVIINVSCTNGSLNASGIGEFIDNGSITSQVDSMIKPSEIKAIYGADMYRRVTDENANTITLFKEDGVTVDRVFDYVENLQGAVIEIAPQ